MRVNVGKRIFQDPATGIFKTISVFSEVEPEPEVNQIREFRPNLALLAQESVDPVPEPVPVALDPEPPVAPAKPKRVYKPRPYKPRPKKK
jgi:hypothetical protein